MDISDFLNFYFFTPKISKKKYFFFRKMITKSKIFKKFKKQEYML